MISREELVEQSAFMAAMLEVSAPKPGNVSPFHSKGKTRFEHFIASASAIAPVMGRIATGGFSLGQGIFHAVNRSMSAQKGGNVHLGVILLFAPISSAAGISESLDLASLRREIGEVIDSAGYQDTVYVFNAIKYAEPSGIQKEVFTEKELEQIIGREKRLKEWMKDGEEHNLIAREYARDFEISFETALPTLLNTYREGHDIFRSIVTSFITVLSRYEDSLILGKFGKEAAEDVRNRAKKVLRDLSDESLRDFDIYLREKGMNPGTSADIVASALYIGIVSGEIRV